MAQPDHTLQAARDAFARGNWAQARDRLQHVDASGHLDAPDLDLLARSLWLLGQVAESLPVAERAFTAFVADGCTSMPLR